MTLYIIKFKWNILLGVNSGMSNHNIAVQSDGQNGENRDGEESVAHQREEGAESVTVDPAPVVEKRCCQWKIEAAEH